MGKRAVLTAWVVSLERGPYFLNKKGILYIMYLFELFPLRYSRCNQWYNIVTINVLCRLYNQSKFLQILCFLFSFSFSPPFLCICIKYISVTIELRSIDFLLYGVIEDTNKVK